LTREVSVSKTIWSQGMLDKVDLRSMLK